MKPSLIKILALASVIGAAGVFGQDTDTADPTNVTPLPGVGRVHDARVRGRADEAIRLHGIDNLPTEVQDLINQFQQQRQDWVANRRELLARLQNMTEEERKAAIAELRLMQREQVRQQRELARQIRDEMRELRNSRRRGGGNGGGGG